MKEGRRSVRCRWLITVLVLQASFRGGLVSASSNSASAAPDVTITTAASATSTSTPSSSQPSAQPSLTAATATVASTFRTQTMEFFKKFDSYGPTLTLTLRDPSRTALLGGGQGSTISGGTDRKRKLLWSSNSKKHSIHDAPKQPKKKPRAAVPDDGTFGIYSKIAAHFHVSSSASTATNGAGDYSTTSGAAKSTQYSDGYMLDDGDIYLDPPSSSSAAASSASSSKGLFSIRDASNRILSGKGTTISTLSECAQNVHPEIKYEIQSKESSLPLFPKSAPWIAGLHCGMIWNPFPIYKPGYPEGYGHKLLSQPHFVRCGVRLSLPRVSHVIQKMRSTSRGINRSFTQQITDDAPATSTTKELDLGVTYQESTYSPTAGTLEVILGKVRPSLPPAKVQDGTPSLNHGINSQSLRQSDEVYRRHNHLLLRLSTAGNTNSNGKQNSIITPEQHPFLSSIEYIKASVRFPTPWFLRTRYNDRLSVSPSFDFVEGVGRCTFSGDVGRSGRTRAVLRLDSEEESTLTIVRALDESKIIAPTISLNTGKIVYDYYLNLDGKQQQQNNECGKVNSSLRAHVDPTKGILLKWTDGIRSSSSGGSGSSGSCWVTECRIPLGTSAPGSPLAADVRVGRRWVI